MTGLPPVRTEVGSRQGLPVGGRSAGLEGGDGARPRGSLSREEIIKEALALLDEHGPGALSMRRLADRLGVSAMTVLSWRRALVGLLATLNWAKTPSQRLQLV